MTLKSPTQKYTGANVGPQRGGPGPRLPIWAALEPEGRRHLATMEAPKPGLGLSSFGEGGACRSGTRRPGGCQELGLKEQAPAPVSMNPATRLPAHTRPP